VRDCQDQVDRREVGYENQLDFLHSSSPKLQVTKGSRLYAGYHFEAHQDDMHSPMEYGNGTVAVVAGGEQDWRAQKAVEQAKNSPLHLRSQSVLVAERIAAAAATVSAA
jgi:hypothetical protein